MSKIEVGRYSELLRKLLSMKGVVDVSGELSPEISPVFILEAERPEWEFLKNEKVMSSTFAVNAVAAQNAVYRLRNPLGSGVVAVINTFMIQVESDSTVLAERSVEQGNLATILPTVSRDTRLPVLNASALISSQANNVVFTGESFWTALLLANAFVPQVLDFVLTAGHQFDLIEVDNNISIRGWVQWRERRLDVLEEP